MQDDLDKSNTSSEAGKSGFFRSIWGFFSSMKTAIMLLLVLAAASVAGTLITQNAPPEMYVNAYGETKYAVFRFLGLTNLYHSAWYTALLALIGINLAVCSINRFGIAWRRTYSLKISIKPKQVTSMPRSETFTFPGSLDDAKTKVVTALRSGAYHISEAQESDGISIYATKGRLSIWGPYLTHLSILVIFAGAILGSKLGFEGFAVITEGKDTSAFYVKSTGEERSLDFEVGLKSFTIEHDAEHNPTAYKSDLTIYDGGKAVAQKVIDVNHPLTYKGVSFFQSDYGLDGITIKVTAPNGETKQIDYAVETHDGSGGKEYAISGEAFREVRLGGKKLTFYAHGLAPDYIGGEAVNATYMPINPAVLLMVNDRFPEYKGLDAWTKMDWLPVGESADYKGFKITLEKAVDYTVLQVAKNPGLPIVYAGFALMLMGVFVSFYVTHRTVRVNISPSKKGTSVAVGMMARAEPSIFDKDYDRLRESLS